MNTATRTPTFRCDCELGAVLVAFSRVTQQTVERLNAYEQKLRQFNMIRTGFRMTQPSTSQSMSQRVNATNVPLYADETKSLTAREKDIAEQRFIVPVSRKTPLSLTKMVSLPSLGNIVLNIAISIISSEISKRLSKDTCCERLLAEFKKFADKDRTHVREARERLISLLGTDRAVEELVRHVENAPGRSLPGKIYETIRSEYGPHGEQAAEDVLTIVQARAGLRAVRDLLGETTQAYKEAAAARAALTATEEEGLQTQQKATRTLEQQAEAAQQLVDVTLTQGQATKGTTTTETARNRGLLMLTQQTRDAFVQVSNLTD